MTKTNSDWLVEHVASRLRVHPRTVRRRLAFPGACDSMVPLRRVVAAFGIMRPDQLLDVLVGQDEAWSVEELALFLGLGRRAIFERMKNGYLSPLIRRGHILRFSMNEAVAKETGNAR